MNILLTGAFGNIGMSSLKELLVRRHHVRCLDLRTRTNRKTSRRFHGQIEVQCGDIRRAEDLSLAVQNQDVIIHLAAILPPASNEYPQLAEQVNVEGTWRLIEAAKHVDRPPKFLLASSFTVFGRTQDQTPPRHVSDSTQATDPYSRHKLACEEMVRRSRLEWLVFRFAHVPRGALSKPQRLMFEIPLSNRFEVLHSNDAGLAVANAIECADAWNKTLLVGGGRKCQIYYRDYLNGMLGAMGIGPLPEEAFTTNQYPTDWMDTEESQSLLGYQRHSMEDVVRDTANQIGVWRRSISLIRPLVASSILRLSPYWKVNRGAFHK